MRASWKISIKIFFPENLDGWKKIDHKEKYFYLQIEFHWLKSSFLFVYLLLGGLSQMGILCTAYSQGLPVASLCWQEMVHLGDTAWLDILVCAGEGVLRHTFCLDTAERFSNKNIFWFLVLVVGFFFWLKCSPLPIFPFSTKIFFNWSLGKP